MQLFHKGQIPFVRLLIPLMAGILGGWFLPQPIAYTWGLTSLAIILALFALTLTLYARTVLLKHAWYIGVMVHIFLFSAGYTLCIQSDQRNHSSYLPANADALVIKIISEPLRKRTLNIRSSSQYHLWYARYKINLHNMPLKYGKV